MTLPAKLWIVFLLASAGAGAQTLSAPQIGFVLNQARELRPVSGVAGNFLIGPPVAGDIVTQAFGGGFGFLKTSSSVSAFNGQGEILGSISASWEPSLFAFAPDGLTGLVYMESSQQLLKWGGGNFEPLSIPFEAGVMRALAFPAASWARLFVQRDQTIWQIEVPLGAIGIASQSALVGVHAPLLQLPSGDIVYRDEGGIVIRRTDASEAHIAASLPKNLSLQQMSSEWVQVTDTATGPSLAIRTTPGREGLYRLPE